MKSRVDFTVAAIGISIVTGAHLWFFVSNFSFVDWRFHFRVPHASEMVRMSCKTYPHGMDGIPCDPTNQLMPVQ